MIDLTINEEQLERTIERAREKNITIPTFEQMKNPELIPDKIKDNLNDIGLWDINSYNLFRITWKNKPVKKGGQFGGVNFVELPHELTGVKARIFALVGKWFPTGSHKVGATFGCLVPRLVTGQFDPTSQKAVWPSTGNYCRGGAYDADILSCESIAILPEGMSRERFDWLAKVAGEVIATPGTESNVKEIFDKTWELKKTREVPFSMLFGMFVLAVIILGFILWKGEDLQIAFIIGVSLIIVVVMAAITGTLVPLVLDKYDIDPAIATGPFITTTNDILGVFIYFSIAQFILY